MPAGFSISKPGKIFNLAFSWLSGKTARTVMTREQADILLHQMLGPETVFREGQWEAIDMVANQRRRLLVVQRTGWGKSIVYFLATKILRDAGGGPTLLVSPLLSLMRNQLLAVLLRLHGSGPVYPLALAKASPKGG